MCAAALLRRGCEIRALGLGGKRGRLSAAAPLPRCPAGGRCPAGAAAPLRCHAALMFAAATGKLDCVEHLIAKGANLEATDDVHPTRAAPKPLHPSSPPSPRCSARTAGGDRVLRQRRASAARRDGPHVGG